MSWELPPVFRWLVETAGLDQSDALKTYNCGIGMIAVVAADRAEALSAQLAAAGETVYDLGQRGAGAGRGLSRDAGVTKRVAILISGSGSNMGALIDSMTGDHPARPVLVISNRADAGGLAKAQAAGRPKRRWCPPRGAHGRSSRPN